MNRDLILPMVTILLAITFTSCYQTLIPRSYLEPMERENMLVYSKLAEADRENRELTKELQSYRVTIQDIEDAGASHRQAVDSLKASQLYNLDPKP